MAENNNQDGLYSSDLSSYYPHDEFFKLTLSDPKAFRSLMKGFFNEYFQPIEPDSISLRPTSYVDKNLRQYFSDLVYSAKFKNGTDVKISLLLEHKSYTDKNVLRQLCKYILNLWDNDQKESKQLSLPLVILLYTGKSKWKPKTLREYFASRGVEDKYLPFVPDYKFLFLSVRELDESQLLEFIESAKLFLWILVSKYIFESPYRMFEIMEKLAELMKSSFEVRDLIESLEVVLKYLSFFRTFAREDLKQKVMETVEKISPLPNSLYMEIFTEGRKEGKEEGKKEGELKVAYLFYKKMKLSIETIAHITGLDAREIEEYIRHREAEGDE